jgi:type VI secretion system protein ImpB
MSDSIQHKLDRVRPPRVHITYDVEIGDAVEQKEIPFVAGVLSDLSGKPEAPLPPIKERKFVEVDRDNFNDVLEGMNPRLQYKVDNKIEDNDTRIGVELKFKSLDDFHPEKVARQIEPIRALVEARRKLYNLLGKLDGNDKLEALLQDVISNSEKLEAIGKSMLADGGADQKNPDKADQED